MSIKAVKIDLSVNPVSFSEKIIDENLKKFKKIVFISPNKRPIWFIKKKLNIDKTLRTDFFTLDEFIKKIVSDKFPLSDFHTSVERELFFLDLIKKNEILKEKLGNEDYKIFPWAKRISKLFDEIDKQLSGDKLHNYQYTESIPEIESILENLKNLYEDYKKDYNNCFYNGKAFSAASDIDDFTEFKNNLIIFFGLVYLSNSEKKLIKKLSSFADVLFIVQTDLEEHDTITFNGRKYYFDTFKLIDNTINELTDNIEEVKKEKRLTEIEFFEIPNIHLEAEFIADKINKLTSEMKEKNSPDKLAIVLPEHRVLFPFLSCFENRNNVPINITMGYPFKNTDLGIFIEALFKVLIELSLNIKKDKRFRISSNSILRLLDTSIFNLLKVNDKEVFQIKEDIFNNENPVVEFCEDSEILNFLKLFLDNDLYVAFKEFYKLIEIKEELKFTNQILNYFYENVVTSLKILNGRKIDIFFSYQLLNEFINDLTIPFEGHPLQGVQIMGMLEARMLSFDTVIIADVNEGILPSGDKIDPLLPDDIKKSLGLASFKEKEQLMKYNFCRLIYSAKKVFILYKIGTSSNEKNIRSRFVEQLILQKEVLDNEKPKIDSFYIKLPQFKRPNDKIEKTEDVFNYFRSKKFSPSAIDEYMRCPYLFYLKRIKNIKEKINLNIEYEADKVGIFVHSLFEKGFKPFVNKNIDKDIYKEIFKNIINNIENFPKDFSKFSEFQLESLKIIIKYRIEKYFNVTLSDFKEFKLLGTEKNFESKSLRLSGKIDRIDEIDSSIIRIIDYKTGSSTKYPKVNLVDDLIIEDFDKKSLETVSSVIGSVQMPAYILMAKEVYENCNILSEIHLLGSLGSKNDYLKKLNDENFDKFEKIIQYLISHMENSEYIYTISGKHCSYCNYKYMCEVS